MGGAAVVLPTYNERETAPAVVGELLEYDTVQEIVVVDDNSPDGTAEIVKDRYPHITVIVREDESGLGSAVLRGFDAAESDVLVVMDADGQHPPGSAISCVRQVQGGADVAVGSRHVDTGAVADDWPAHRQVISWGATALAWAAVPPARQLRDPMSGLFAIRADLVEPVREQLRPSGYKILLELLGRCPVEDVVEVGYTFRKRQGGESNLGAREYARYVRHLSSLVLPARQRYHSTPQQEVQADG
jgi:dolichol-phosphate mannosyltransferase